MYGSEKHRFNYGYFRRRISSVLGTFLGDFIKTKNFVDTGGLGAQPTVRIGGNRYDEELYVVWEGEKYTIDSSALVGPMIEFLRTKRNHDDYYMPRGILPSHACDFYINHNGTLIELNDRVHYLPSTRNRLFIQYNAVAGEHMGDKSPIAPLRFKKNRVSFQLTFILREIGLEFVPTEGDVIFDEIGDEYPIMASTPQIMGNELLGKLQLTETAPNHWALVHQETLCEGEKSHIIQALHKFTKEDEKVQSLSTLKNILQQK